jgi:hypothetical protein
VTKPTSTPAAPPAVSRSNPRTMTDWRVA